MKDGGFTKIHWHTEACAPFAEMAPGVDVPTDPGERRKGALTTRAFCRDIHHKMLRTLWSPELVRWIEWRVAQATPESRMAGAVALFWNPASQHPSKRWASSALGREWRRACDRAGIGQIGFQEGTRHTTLSALGEVMPERVLRAYSRHRNAKSLDHYSKPKATPDAIVRALRPKPGAP